MGGDRRSGFHAELREITRELILLAAHVEEAIPQATDALLDGDVAAAQAVIDHDDVLDRLSLTIEERCCRALATQQPVASDLRTLVTALRMVAEIERSGDLVADICKAVCALHPVELPPGIRGQLTQMSDLAATLFRMGTDAYAEGDAELAVSLDRLDDELDALHASFRETVLR